MIICNRTTCTPLWEGGQISTRTYGDKYTYLFPERRAASVLGQIKGSIPSTWEGQKAQPQQLINSSDINLQDLGGI